MVKGYKPYNHNQIYLFPPAPQDWLPKNHIVFFISDLVDNLDLTSIEKEYEKDSRGQPPFHPALMTKILFYAYCRGVYSSRKIAAALYEEVAFVVLAGGNRPDFRTINEFRRRHIKSLPGIFVQILKLCEKAGLVGLKHVSLDGTKINANASKHKAMSYGRMKTEEQRLEKELKSIISVISISDALKNKTDKYLNQKEFMLHSYMVGAASKKIAKDMGFQNNGEAFIAGFLHDIGISIVHRYLHSNFAIIYDLMETQKLSFRDAEIEVNGMTHEEIGSFLLEKWNFPAEICDAVLNHHNPGKAQTSPSMAAIVSVADYMTQSLKVGELKLDKDNHLDEYTLGKFNFEKELDAEKFATKYKDLFWEQLEFVRFLN
ncbi:MAG: HDOD domain-containing protein [Ignavibacterium sp.]|nr:HDOD domain-containing protein [Ignavibacterium sp.]